MRKTFSVRKINGEFNRFSECAEPSGRSLSNNTAFRDTVCTGVADCHISSISAPYRISYFLRKKLVLFHIGIPISAPDFNRRIHIGFLISAPDFNRRFHIGFSRRECFLAISGVSWFSVSRRFISAYRHIGSYRLISDFSYRHIGFHVGSYRLISARLLKKVQNPGILDFLIFFIILFLGVELLFRHFLAIVESDLAACRTFLQ